MRRMLVASSAVLSRSAIAERWAQGDASQRADLIYQAATLAAAVLLLLTATAI